MLDYKFVFNTIGNLITFDFTSTYKVQIFFKLIVKTYVEDLKIILHHKIIVLYIENILCDKNYLNVNFCVVFNSYQIEMN